MAAASHSAINWSSLDFLSKRLVIVLCVMALLALSVVWQLVRYPSELANQEQTFLNRSTQKRIQTGSLAILPASATTAAENTAMVAKLCGNEKDFFDKISDRITRIAGWTVPPGGEDLLQQELDAIDKKLKKVTALKGTHAFSLTKWHELTQNDTGNRCAEARKTVAELRRGNRLALMAWGQQPLVPEQLLAEPNPWGDLLGCTYVGQPFASGKTQPYYRVAGDPRICAFPQLAEKLPWRKDENLKEAANLEGLLPVMLPLTQYTSPRATPFKEADVKDENVAMIGTHERRAGYHALLSIDPELQEKAQNILGCYVGQQPDKVTCPGYSAWEIQHGIKFEENARVKMAGLVVLDVKTGEILAAASGEWARWRSEESKSEWGHHALETAKNPGSTAKVILSAALINNNFPRLNDLHWMIRTSNSPKFQELARAHPLWFKTQAKDMGWNRGCDGDGKTCGLFGELYGKPLGVQPESGKRHLDTYAMLGRILVEPTATSGRGFRDVEDGRLRTLTPKSKELNIVEQAAIGHGDTLATPVGVAHYMAYIGAAALGEKQVSYPHLVKGLYDIKGRRIGELVNIAPDTVPVRMKQDKARTLIGFLQSTGKAGGTAGHAYQKVFGSVCQHDCIAAGKTGTVDPAGKDSAFTHKWYTGLYKSKGSRDYDRAIAVLVKRGKTTNLSAGAETSYFSSLNKAAEIAFEFIKASR